MVSIYLPAKFNPSTVTPGGEGMAGSAAVQTAQMESLMFKMESMMHKILKAIEVNQHHLSTAAEKLGHMELRSNFSGHDAGAVAWRRLTAELA